MIATLVGNDSYPDFAEPPRFAPGHLTYILYDEVCSSPKPPEFRAFGKIPRDFRDICITEKIDGTNGCVVIGALDEDGDALVHVQSRKRIITPDDDNFGFARWVYDYADELVDRLGPGHHFGEWFGRGIQRGYGLRGRRFALFNTGRWTRHEDRATPERMYIPADACGGTLDVVATLYEGPNEMDQVRAALRILGEYGSQQVPGFPQPEGLIVYHTAGGHYFKVTLDHDEGKGER